MGPLPEMVGLRYISVLGATGSVGRACLAVVRQHPERFSLFALSAYANAGDMFALCVEFKPAYAVMVDAQASRSLSQLLAEAGLATEVLAGAQSLETVATHAQVDVVVAAIVGAAGLRSALATVKAGKRLLLANKEPLVMAGSIFRQAIEEAGAQLIPLDSEHNAIFQCLPAPGSPTLLHTQVQALGVEKITLTASGGPFRGLTRQQLERVTAAQACCHPTWSMGRKISVDSATLMNKGLEWIEACWLFDLTPEQLEVVVHPQSIVHAVVAYQDGSQLAHMSQPSMQVPIAQALAWPERICSGAPALDLTQIGSLNFFSPDLERFPCLRLAQSAFVVGGYMPTLLNAANEVAVDYFLQGKIAFTEIAQVIEAVLEAAGSAPNGLDYAYKPAQDIDSILEADQCARRYAHSLIKREAVWSFSTIPLHS